MSTTYLRSAPSTETVDLRAAVIGQDLVLSEHGEHTVVLHRIEGGHAHRLGEFADAASAWRAIDALDAGAELALAA